MKVLKFLTITIIILFPFGELLRFNLGNNIILKPLDIIVGITALSWFIQTVFKKSKPALKKEFLLFPLIALISLVINITWLKPSEFIASFLYLARWAAYASLFFVVSGLDKPFREKIKLYLAIDGLIMLALGFLQYFFFSSLKGLYYLGWDDHMYRMFSVFLDPNYAGAFFVLYFLFIAHILVIPAKAGIQYVQKVSEHFGVDYRYLLNLVLLLTLIAIFLTFSRSALLMLIGGVSVFLFMIKRKRLILILLGSILLFALIFSSKFYVENMNLFREASVKARLGNYSTSLKIIIDHPLLGVGFNTYRYAKETYGIQMGWVNAPSHADAGVDNSFLFVLATTGIIGFSAYLFLWASIVKKASPLVISSIIALFINALFINSLFFPPLMLWMWFILALL